jgi:membrane protease YdiL (CAAX protease family)
MPQPTAANREHEAQGRLPWPPAIVYSLIAVGAAGGIAVFMKSAALDMRSPVWFLLAPLAMWAPALARFVVLRTVDRRFRATLPLQHFAGVGGHATVVALALPIVVYGTAYGIAWIAGWLYWSPGGGLWTTNSRIALNVLVNLSILGTYGTMTALGEELGWRGYLQPRLDTAGMRGSFVVVGLFWSIYHAPFTLVDWSGTTAGLAFALAKGLVLDVSLSYLWAQLSYRAKSLWPAVFLHSFHNGVSQWLFPKFFAGGDETWLGEAGVLPLSCYVVAAIGLSIVVRRQGGRRLGS